MRTIISTGILIICILALEFTSLFSHLEILPKYLSRIVRRDFLQVPSSATTLGTGAADGARLHVLEDENKQLREQLAFVERTGQKPLLARRIGRSTDPLQSEIIIDRGSSDGVMAGDPVLAGDGILVGIIHTSDASKSFVRPLSNPRSKVLSRILRDTDNIRGITEGQYNTGLSMTLIPISDELRKDDIVVTTGLQERIPAGLIIGTVQDVVKRPEDLFQSAVLKSALSIDDISIMSILIATQRP
ncbi:rod shape-determining protein MreC [Candidatus Uhrbacteria bacterium]|nr:rod shape-determining protein MreC [Candidatus Uhrbacteria bacterium]